jgi:hypothetical protein
MGWDINSFIVLLMQYGAVILGVASLFTYQLPIDLVIALLSFILAILCGIYLNTAPKPEIEYTPTERRRV